MKTFSRISTLASIVTLGVALGLQPLSIDLSSFDTGVAKAHAKEGNGGGNGGGDKGDSGGGRGGDDRGGDKGERGGNGGDRGNSGSSKADDATEKHGSKSASQGQQNLGLVEGFMRDLKGDHKSKHSQAEKKTGAKSQQAAARTTEKTSASSLGRLNAAHASAQALANASPNSTVGKIASYKDALAANDLDAAAEALASVSNKAVTEASVKSLNDLLDVELDDANVATLVDKVDVIESKTTTTTTETTTTTTTTTAATTTEQPVEPTKAPDSMGRLNAAHASPRAMERASLNSPVGQIGAYKTALAANDLDAAAEALAKASNKPVTTETVKNINTLLGTTLTDDQVTEVVEKTQTLKAETSAKASKKTSSITR